jgi:hypothetical protein
MTFLKKNPWCVLQTEIDETDNKTLSIRFLKLSVLKRFFLQALTKKLVFRYSTQLNCIVILLVTSK